MGDELKDQALEAVSIAVQSLFFMLPYIAMFMLPDRYGILAFVFLLGWIPFIGPWLAIYIIASCVYFPAKFVFCAIAKRNDIESY